MGRNRRECETVLICIRQRFFSHNAGTGRGTHMILEKIMNKPLIAKINDKFETLLLIIQAGALIIITLATAVAIVAEGYDMFATKSIGLANLLLLFLFIEILSMVRQYSLGQHELKLKTPLVITVLADGYLDGEGSIMTVDFFSVSSGCIGDCIGC